MKEFIRVSWQLKNVANRGFSESDKASQVADVDGLLSNVAGYSPPPLFRASEQRCRSLSEVWDLIRSGLESKLFSYAELQSLGPIRKHDS